MRKLLIVIDMQNDFIDGALGTQEAVDIVPKVVDKIKNWDGEIITTQDTHYENYLETSEGKHLPVPHCIDGSEGHHINKDIFKALSASSQDRAYLDKPTFGSTALPEIIRGKRYDRIELIGVCTDICVVSNALILKANYPETEIFVDASCCAGTTKDNHAAAIQVMKMCQINIIEE